MKSWLKKATALAIGSAALVSAQASAATAVIICGSNACLIIIIR